jgi:large subunit ribosomal protein L24
MKIRKGDEVIVLQGKDKGRTGIVLEAYPKTNKLIVEGVNVAKRHTKSKSAMQQAGIVDKLMPINASNVAVVSKGQPSRVGARVDGDRKVRFAKRTGEVLGS